MAEIYLGLKATVTGEKEIARLESQLRKVYQNTLTQTEAEKIAGLRREKTIIEIERKNMITKEMVGVDQTANFELARQRVEWEQNSYQLQQNNAELERAVWVQQEYGMSMEDSILAAREMLQAEKELAIQEEQDAIRKAELLNLEKSRRRELMQASIGMFVMGITMTQTLETMAKMSGENEMLANSFREAATAVRFMLGPIQVVTAAMQFMNMENKALMLSMAKWMIMLGGVYLLWKGLTQAGGALRVVLIGLGAAIIAYTAITKASAVMDWIKTAAEVAKGAAKVGSATFGIGAAPYVAAMIGIIAGAVAGIGAIAFKGQTAPGYARTVEDTGLIYAHRGEVLGRAGMMTPSSVGSNMTVIFNIPENSVVSTDMVDYMTSELEILSNSGRGG